MILRLIATLCLSGTALAAPPLGTYTPEADLRGSWDAEIDPALPNILILCYRNPEVQNQGSRDKVNGTVSTTPNDYETQLETLAKRLR